MIENKLLVLADDLTGALDTGVQFAKNGVKTLVYPGLPSAQTPELIDDISVRVINTNTRHCTAEQANSMVEAAVSMFKGHSFFYKKTDSCLRGNIGSELQALMRTTGNKQLAFVPAYPALNRITLGGFQYLDGKLIHESAMANDPLNPIDESFIPAIIAKQSYIPARLFSVNDVDTLTQDNPIPAAEPEILVFDSEKAEHLKHIADVLYAKGLLGISAGCAGFAQALLDVLPLSKSAKQAQPLPAKLPILIISGSIHPVSINQVKAALEYMPGFSLDDEKAAVSGWTESGQAQSLVTSCLTALEEKGICLLGTDAAFGISSPKKTGNVAEILGELVLKIIQIGGPIHLVVFGGDTLLGIIDKLGFNCFMPQTEIGPGVVVSTPQGQDKVLLVSKSGAFGDDKVVAKIIKYFGLASSG